MDYKAEAYKLDVIEHLYHHIQAVGPITLEEMLGWLDKEFNLSTNEEVACWQRLAMDGRIEPYDDTPAWW